MAYYLGNCICSRPNKIGVVFFCIYDTTEQIVEYHCTPAIIPIVTKRFGFQSISHVFRSSIEDISSSSGSILIQDSVLET